MTETATVDKCKASPAWRRSFFENEVPQLVRRGLHLEAFTQAVADGLSMYELTRALDNRLVVDKFSQLLELGYSSKRINDALEIANDEYENIPDCERRIGKAQFGPDIDTYLERIWLLRPE